MCHLPVEHLTVNIFLHPYVNGHVGCGAAPALRVVLPLPSVDRPPAFSCGPRGLGSCGLRRLVPWAPWFVRASLARPLWAPGPRGLGSCGPRGLGPRPVSLAPAASWPRLLPRGVPRASQVSCPWLCMAPAPGWAPGWGGAARVGGWVCSPRLPGPGVLAFSPMWGRALTPPGVRRARARLRKFGPFSPLWGRALTPRARALALSPLHVCGDGLSRPGYRNGLAPARARSRPRRKAPTKREASCRQHP